MKWKQICIACGNLFYSEIPQTLCEFCRINMAKSDGKPKDHDSVNHPKYYTSHPSGIECIQITRHMNFNIGNAIKYLWRYGRKADTNTIQDLEKAIWYINDEIKKLKEGGLVGESSTMAKPN